MPPGGFGMSIDADLVCLGEMFHFPLPGVSLGAFWRVFWRVFGGYFGGLICPNKQTKVKTMCVVIT